MPHLSDVDFHPSVLAELEPLIGTAAFSDKEEAMVWVEQGAVRLELENIGEGSEGDYNEDDEDDTPLLRFSFYARNADDPTWISLDDASYCTAIDARAPWEVRLACAAGLFNVGAPTLQPGDGEEVDASWGRRVKGICEQLSWTSDSDQALESLRVALKQQALDEALPTNDIAPRAPRM